MPRSLRAERVPKNVIVLWDQSGTLPTGYSHVSSLFNKFPKSIPTAATNPGTGVGSDSHSETSIGPSHTHTNITDNHGHVFTVSFHTQASNKNTNNPDATSQPHTHAVNSTSTSASYAVAATSFAHIHDSQSIVLSHITSRYIKNTGSISLRRKNLEHQAIILYNKTLATIPSNFSLLSAYNDKFIRGVPDAATAPGTTAGSNTHQHGSTVAGHTHNVTDCHTHTISSLASFTGTSRIQNCPGNVVGTHAHGAGSLAVTANSSSFTSDTSDSHQHDSISHVPENHETAYIKHNKIELRHEGIIPNGIVLWLCPVADIATGFQVSDGTNGTANMLGRYGKGVLNDCTDPGTQAGNTTHQHASQTHIHGTINLSHTHAFTGVSASTTGTTKTEGTGLIISTTHSHSAVTPSDSGGNTAKAFTTDPGHQHATNNNCPSSVETAFLVRV